MFLRETFCFPFSAALPISLLATAGWGVLGTRRPNKASGPAVSVLFFMALAGALYISLSREGAENFNYALGLASPPMSVESSGTVIDDREWGFGRVALLDSPKGRYVLKLDAVPDGPPDFTAGDRVSFSGRLGPFKRALDGRAFDEYLYWRAQGAVAAITRPEARRLGVSRGLVSWRTSLASRIKKALPPRTAGYVLASLVGERDRSLSDLHKSVGTSHLLAVSGAHVAIVFGILWFFLKGVRSRLYIISALVWLYVAMTGAAPSAMRAAFMIQLVIGGRLIGRRGKPFNSVCAAGAIMLIHNPWLFDDVGWRLSMLAALSITSTGSIQTRARFFLASALVWLATTLQASWTFGGSPLVGLFVNIFALPAFGVLFPLAFALSMPSLLGLSFGVYAAAIPEFLFLRWERFSLNLLALCPWNVDFSVPLLLLGIAALVYFFGRACGFGGTRACFASGISLFGVFALLFLV